MNRQEFYRSKQWETFRAVIIEQHTDADGFVHCSQCGKPILHKYDLIIHLGFIGAGNRSFTY